MVGDVWNSSIKYRFRLTTIDHDYDDKLNFDMELLVTKSELTEVVNIEVRFYCRAIHVGVSYKTNIICYY
jgi:hypothetical protein